MSLEIFFSETPQGAGPLRGRGAADPSSHARKPPRRVRVQRILGRLRVGDCMDAARILCYDVLFLGGFRKEDSVGIP